MTNVLSPSLAKLSHSSCIYPRQIGLQRSIMTISAPFKYKIRRSVNICRTIIPMRLVQLEKGKLARTSYFYYSSAGLLTISQFLLRSFSTNPSSSANLTKAISSGLEACKTLTPSSVTGVTLLQRIRAVARSLCRNYCLLFAFFFILHNRCIYSQESCRSPRGPENFLQALTMPFFSQSISSVVQRVSLRESFLKTISLQVSVPVLSLSKYYILPNYSGIELFLHTVQGRRGSLLILYEKYVLQKSRLTLKLMGIMLARRSTYLKKYRGHRRLNYLKTFMTRAKISMSMNSILERQLIYQSNLPILVRGQREFMFALVSRPVKITIPVMWPAASTVLAQAVLSNPRASLLLYPVQEPKNSQISSQAGAQLMTESCMMVNLSTDRMEWVVRMALRTFQSVSPSSWSVLIKIEPVGSEVERMTISAGTLSLACISNISPTCIS